MWAQAYHGKRQKHNGQYKEKRAVSGSDGSYWSSLRNKPEQQDSDLRLKRNNHPAVPCSEIRKPIFEAIKQERVEKVNEKHRRYK